MTNKMPAEWKKTSKKNSPETLMSNTKDMRRAATESERQQQQPEANTWVSVTKERLRVNKKTSCRHERYQLMERHRNVKRRALVPGWSVSVWERLPSSWRKTIIRYQLGSGAPNSGVYTLDSVRAHIHAGMLGYLLTQGRIRTLLVLLRGAVWGIS